MKKLARLVLILALLPYFISLVDASTTIGGTGVNISQIGGVAPDVNSGNKSLGTIRVTLATDQVQLANALKVDLAGTGANATAIKVDGTGGSFPSAPTYTAPSVSSRAVTGASFQQLASNATRKGLEIQSSCTNTDDVGIAFGAAAAVIGAANTMLIKPCANWQAPGTLGVNTAIQIIANSGTQGVWFIEYP